MGVFTGVVKIRKGLSCKLIVNTKDLAGVMVTFNIFAKSIERKLDKNDPSYERTKLICTKILFLTEEAYGKKRNKYRMQVSFFDCMIEKKVEMDIYIAIPFAVSLLIITSLL